MDYLTKEVVAMKSWKQKGIEEKQKQKWLDEIHAKPNVKKTFKTCEMFLLVDWISTMLFLIVFNIAIWGCDLGGMADSFDLYDLIDNLFMAVGGTQTGLIIVGAYLIVKSLLGRIKKKKLAELEVLDDAGIMEIEKQVAEGTYVPGPTVSKAYRVYRDIRTCSVLLSVLALFAGFLVAFVF